MLLIGDLSLQFLIKPLDLLQTNKVLPEGNHCPLNLGLPQNPSTALHLTKFPGWGAGTSGTYCASPRPIIFLEDLQETPPFSTGLLSCHLSITSDESFNSILSGKVFEFLHTCHRHTSHHSSDPHTPPLNQESTQPCFAAVCFHS